jgi:hypothetical protein
MFLNRGKNLIINGAADMWQRGTSIAAVANGEYTADRFVYTKSGTMVHTIARDTDVPTLAQCGAVLPYSIKLTLTTPQASLAVGEFCGFAQRIEGNLFSLVHNKKFTLSFWVKSSVTGERSIAFRNKISGPDRSLVKSYTIDQVDTWEKKTLTVQHSNIGTWDTASSVGIDIMWCLASGTSYHASQENQWLDGNFIALSSTINNVDTGSGDLKIAGIMLEEGEHASGFERAGRDIVSELQLCQRYFEKSYPVDTAPGTVTNRNNGYHYAATTLRLEIPFKVNKRTAGVAIVYNAMTGAANNVRVEGSNYAAVATCRVDAIRFSTTGNTVLGDPGYEWTADAEL